MPRRSPAFLGSFGGAIDFIFSQRESVQAGGSTVGGLDQMLGPAARPRLAISVARAGCWRSRSPCRSGSGSATAASASSLAVARRQRRPRDPRARADRVDGRRSIGVGVLNVTIALTILGIPPILTNAFVGMRQVDRGAVDAARGMGMTELEIIRKVELPLAIPTIMGGVRTATVNIVATATIAPLAGVMTLGDFIITGNVYGDEGVLAGAIVVALLALDVRAGPRRRSSGCSPRAA